MTYIKGLADHELVEFIETTNALVTNAINIGAMHASMGIRDPRRYPRGIERMNRELDIAVAVRRRRIREGRWDPEGSEARARAAEEAARWEGYERSWRAADEFGDDGYDWDTPRYESGASHGPWDMSA